MGVCDPALPLTARVLRQGPGARHTRSSTPLAPTPDPTVQRRAVRVTLAVAAAVIAVDLATKLWARAALADGPVDLGWVALRLAENPGVAFSLGADAPAWVVIGLTSAATVAIGVMALRGVLHPPSAGGLLLGGGLGNLLDRLAGGTVTDMIDLGWFPSFNVADIALNVGVALVLLAGLLGDEHRADDEQDEDEGRDEDEVHVARRPG